jgi:hypothetical protein
LNYIEEQNAGAGAKKKQNENQKAIWFCIKESQRQARKPKI